MTNDIPFADNVRMTRHAAANNARKRAESILRDWAQVNGYSSALLRSDARWLMFSSDLTALDPYLKAKLAQICEHEPISITVDTEQSK